MGPPNRAAMGVGPTAARVGQVKPAAPGSVPKAVSPPRRPAMHPGTPALEALGAQRMKLQAPPPVPPAGLAQAAQSAAMAGEPSAMGLSSRAYQQQVQQAPMGQVPGMPAGPMPAGMAPGQAPGMPVAPMGGVAPVQRPMGMDEARPMSPEQAAAQAQKNQALAGRSGDMFRQQALQQAPQFNQQQAWDLMRRQGGF